MSILSTPLATEATIMLADFGTQEDGAGGYLNSLASKLSLAAVVVIGIIWLISIIRIYAKDQGAGAKKEAITSTVIAACLVAVVGLFWSIVGIISSVGGSAVG